MRRAAWYRLAIAAEDEGVLPHVADMLRSQVWGEVWKESGTVGKAGKAGQGGRTLGPGRGVRRRKQAVRQCSPTGAPTPVAPHALRGDIKRLCLPYQPYC